MRRVDGVEVDAKIQREGAIKFDFHTGADHRAHMAYTKNGEAEGECPGTHPVRLPQIAVFTRIAPYAGGVHLFSDGTGYFHAQAAVVKGPPPARDAVEADKV